MLQKSDKQVCVEVYQHLIIVSSPTELYISMAVKKKDKLRYLLKTVNKHYFKQ